MKGHTQNGLPFQGSTPISAHHSAEGAKAAAPGRAVKTRLYLTLLECAGQVGLSDHEAARAMGVPNTSITSIRDNLWPLIVPAARRAESPYHRYGRPLMNTCWRLATETEQERLRDEERVQNDVPF